MVFNATFKNISVVVSSIGGETRVLRENHRPVTSY